MKASKIMFPILVTALLLATAACASSKPAEGVPPVADEVNTVRPIEKPGEAESSDDEDFGSFEVPEDESEETSEESEAEETASEGEAAEDGGEGDAAEEEADAAETDGDGESGEETPEEETSN